MLTRVWRTTNADDFGEDVASAGDVNGDGYADLVVGSPNEGAAFVYLGSATGLESIPSWSAESVQEGWDFGAAVASAGDVNGDGYDDVVVGAPLYNSGQREGGASLYLGSETGLGATPAWTAESDEFENYFGSDVGSAGDVNGDGYDDVFVLAPDYRRQPDWFEATGRVAVFLGSAIGLEATASWHLIANNGPLHVKGPIQAASAGDVNADGYGDLIVGRPGLGPDWYWDGPYYAADEHGKAALYLGSASGLATTPAWTATEGDDLTTWFGEEVASAGDVNGDGYDDVVIGMPYPVEAQHYYYGTDDFRGPGSAVVFHGSATGLDATPAWLAVGREDQDMFGFAVASAGDVNGDGYADVIIGAWGHDGPLPHFPPHQDAQGAGLAELFLGSASGLQTTPAWIGTAPRELQLAKVVAPAGDVDGDGYDDVAMNAYFSIPGIVFNGSALLYAGGCGAGPLELPFSDADGDLVGDQCDVCPGWDDLSDLDYDDVPAGCDLCPDVYDPEQRDADGDGIGNLCES